MLAVQAEDVRASFLFLGSTPTNLHVVAAFDFTTVSGCDQLAVGPTHARCVTLDLLMTEYGFLL